MGQNCCSQADGQRDINTGRKIRSKSKAGAEALESQDLLFNETNMTVEPIDNHELYSDFSVEDEGSDSGDATDWDNYINDVTFVRKGNSKPIFNEDIIQLALESASPELRKWHLAKGPLNIKPKDVPEDVNDDEVEFKKIQVKNKDGDMYIGSFRKGTTIREGRGILISNENYIYEGFWIDDVKYGFGRLIMSNGNTYQGDWDLDMSQGRGIYSTEDEMIYKGDWKDNKCHGVGAELYKDGSKFIGKFKNGEKNGKGVFKWSDGKTYKGEFKGGIMHGKGTFTWPDGRSYNGDWANNK